MSDTRVNIETASNTRRCQGCGDHFKPWHSGQRFCGARAECEREEREMELERREQAIEAAETDNYERY
jgi:hypothetical protein